MTNNMKLFSKLHLHKRNLNTVTLFLRILLGWRNCLTFRRNLKDQPILKLEAQHYYMKLLILVLNKTQRISILERTVQLPRKQHLWSCSESLRMSLCGHIRFLRLTTWRSSITSYHYNNMPSLFNKILERCILH